MITGHRTAFGALFLCVLILAFQDVYLAVRLDRIHPAQLIVVMFSCVTAFALVGLAVSRPNWPKYSPSVFRDFLLFNISTSASWIGTFLALKNLQPTVVSALTLSVPPTFSVLRSIHSRPGRFNRVTGTVLVVAGVFLAVLAEPNLNFQLDDSTIVGLIAALIGALGVWGNAEFSRRIAQAGFTTNQTFCFRFLMLIVLSAVYLCTGPYYTDLTPIELSIFSLIAVFTFYLPMLLLYRSSIWLSVHSITIGLALTPLVTLALQSQSHFKVTPYEIVGMTLLGLGVIIGISNQRKGTT